MRKRLSAMLLAAAALMLISVPARAEFVTTDQGIVYQTSEGIVTGLRKVGENYYLFDGSGYMQTGVQVIKGNWYYFSLTTGKMLYGWIREGKKTYYADPSTGILYRSRAYGSHYFNADGTERTYGSGADTAAGAAAGSWVKKNKKTYYYSAAGTYVTGMQILVPSGRERMTTISTVWGACLNLIVNFALIPRMGAMGAVIGTVMAELVVLAVQIWYLKGELGLYLKDLELGKILTANGAACAALAVIRNLLQMNAPASVLIYGMRILLSGLVFCGIYLGLLAAEREKTTLAFFGKLRG